MLIWFRSFFNLNFLTLDFAFHRRHYVHDARRWLLNVEIRGKEHDLDRLCEQVKLAKRNLKLCVRAIDYAHYCLVVERACKILSAK